MNKIEIPKEVIDYALWQMEANHDNFMGDPKIRLGKIDKQIAELQSERLSVVEQIAADETRKARFEKFLNDIGYDLERHHSKTIPTTLQDQGAS